VGHLSDFASVESGIRDWSAFSFADFQWPREFADVGCATVDWGIAVLGRITIHRAIAVQFGILD
jgi:hypothetical protein